MQNMYINVYIYVCVCVEDRLIGFIKYKLVVIWKLLQQ